MPVPDFSVGEVFTASAADQIGLWKIGGATANGTSTALTIDNIFTSNFANYMIAVRNFNATAGELRFRLRANGVDADTTYYSASALAPWTGAVSAGGQINNGGYYYVGFTNGATIPNSWTMYVFGPRTTARTAITHQGLSFWDLSASGAGWHNQTTAYDGFKLYHASANVTGTVTVYGLRD